MSYPPEFLPGAPLRRGRSPAGRATVFRAGLDGRLWCGMGWGGWAPAADVPPGLWTDSERRALDACRQDVTRLNGKGR